MIDFIHGIVQLCRDNPSLLLFGSLSAGYALGKVKFGTFSLGATTSVLLVAIVLGALMLRGHKYDLGLIKTISFSLFIFAIGYRVGPDFISGLKRGGVKYIAVSVFFCVTALVAAIVLAKVFVLDAGYAGGLLGGALTQSAVIGTADGVLEHMATGKVTPAMNLKSDVAVAYAVTYIFGTAGLIILLKILPGLWRIDLPKAAQAAEAELGSVEQHDTMESFHWSGVIIPRGYTVTNPDAVGKRVEEIEAMFDGRVDLIGIKRGQEVMTEITPDMTLETDDLICLLSYRDRLYKAPEWIGKETDDQEMHNILGESVGVCLTHKALDGKTVEELFQHHGHGVFLKRVVRQAHDLPVAPMLKVHRGDVLHVTGRRSDVEGFIKRVGYPERATQVADLITVGVGIIVGILIGIVVMPVKNIPITLGVGGGVLLSGILFGWLRSLRPTWGYIPAPTLWVFSDLGLNLFIACVGISAGPRALEALQQAGLNIFFAGVCLTCIPHLLTWLFGLYLLKMNPVLLLGAMTGAGTCTAAMNAVKDDARSSVPVIGYTVPYAIGNVLLTVWGALIVSLV